jgi:phosphatidylserine/phosphatidylglycerophosphate/cardiolipin synthase-like enzyme
MLAMCAAFLAAKSTIWLADWDLHAQLLMVRGRDQRAGTKGSPEQQALVARLHQAGLDDPAITLWTAGKLRVVDVLGFAAGRGVDVRVLLWSPYDPRGVVHMVNNPTEQQRLLQERGVQCRLDKCSRSPLHVAQALHQKCAVVDGRTAFVGGVDLTVQYGGDYDRWDTPSHPFDADARATDLGPAPHPWHDAHVLLTGAPARDVERNIRQRWEETERSWWRQAAPPLTQLGRMYLSGKRYSGQRALRAEEQGDLPPGAGPVVAGTPARVQVVRTIPALTYRFAPAGIYGIAQAYTLAARRAQRFIYLESQYFWRESFVGIDLRRVGWQSHHMRTLLSELAAAAERHTTSHRRQRSVKPFRRTRL